MPSPYQRLFASLYNPVMQSLEARLLQGKRAQLLQHAQGRILEIGVGTGANFPFYQPGQQILALEPNRSMLARAQEIPCKAEVEWSTETLESLAASAKVERESLDTVVCTLVLCSVPSLSKSLTLIHQWLKPEGKLLILEHIRSDVPWKGKVEDVVNPCWNLVADGCNLNRQTDKVLKAHGFKALDEHYFSMRVRAYWAVMQKA